MRTRSKAGRVLVAMAVAITSGACTSASSDGPEAGDPSADRPAPPTTVAEPQATDERIESTTVPLPDDVVGPRFPWWSADGDELVFAAEPPGAVRTEIMSVAPDGSGLRCLTCGVAPEVEEPLLKPIPFPDGERIAVRVGNQNPLTPADHAVLECTPSVSDCRDAALVPLVPPSGDDPSVTQDQREIRLAPDGEHVGISQVRTSTGGESTLIAVVGRLRRTADAYEIDEPRVVSPRGELKSFTPDGTAVLVAEFTPGPFEVANPDVVAVDLATGDVERVTTAPDYDEPVEVSPDGEWHVVGSGRGSGLFETVSQVRRPSLLGTALDPLTAFLFARHRADLLDGWIVRAGTEADGALGQQIPAPEGGYDSRPIWNWRPDGTAITYWEGRGSGFETDPTDTHLVVAELPDRAPVERVEAEPIATPAWAPPLAGFVPDAVPLPESRDGRDRGSATVEVTEHPDGLTVQVTFDGFSDDGEWIVDGTERAERHGGRTSYTADLTLSGDHDGYLRADAEISVGGIEGEITSSVDGRELTLPAPGDEAGG